MPGYRLERYSERASTFVLANARVFAKAGQEIGKLPLIESGVWIHIVEMDDQLKVMMEVGDLTKHKDLNQAAIIALIWRDRLIEEKQPAKKDEPTEFLNFLHSQNKRDDEDRKSYKELAEIVNRSLASLLLEISAYQKGLMEARSQGDEEEYVRSSFLGLGVEDTPDPLSFSNALDLLSTFGIGGEDAERILTEGLRDIGEGIPPFVYEPPISRELMKTALRLRPKGKRRPYPLPEAPNDNPESDD